LAYFPPKLNPAQPAPLMFVHHGFTMSGEIMRQLTQYQALADQDNFVVVFPDGAGSTWNAGIGICGMGQLVSGLTDDFSFVEAMIKDVESFQRIDRARTFITGFSMGGYFSNHIGCKRPDLVKAIAPHSGSGPPTDSCDTSPLPVLILHGTADGLISYECGDQSRKYWVQHNRCSSNVTVKQVRGGNCEYHTGCSAGGQVVFCSFDEMGHGWAGVSGSHGGGTQFEDATTLIWNFFKSL
jgi:polyhydroxybutyrate depolymerase